MKHRRQTIFGINVHRLRKARKWSQETLAEKVGVIRPTISEIESGATQSPDISTMEALAKALGTTVPDLWRDTSQPTIEDPLAAFLSSDIGASAKPSKDELALLRQALSGWWEGVKPSPLSLYHLLLAIRTAKK